MADMKTCKTCERSLPLTSFHSHRGHPDGLYNHCKDCYNARQRALYKAGYLLEERAAYQAGYTDRLKVKRRARRYGIAPEEYERLMREQGGRCAICDGTETYEHHQLCVDHDHASGLVRGLLCSRCNKALGGFNDDPLLLQAATRYLQRALPVRPA